MPIRAAVGDSDDRARDAAEIAATVVPVDEATCEQAGRPLGRVA